MSKFRVALCLAALSAPTLAWSQSAPNTSPAAVQAGDYVVDPAHTQVGFTVSHMGFSYYSGRFSDVSGVLDLKPNDAATSTVHITVPVKSVSTTSSKLDGELKGADWLDATKYPDMSFRSTKVTPGQSGEAQVAGDLTLHGVTKPVTLNVHFVGSGTNPISKKYDAGFRSPAT